MSDRPRRLVFAPQARRDVTYRADYLTVEAGVEVSERFLESLEHSTELLRSTPKMGRVFRIRKQDQAEFRRIVVSDPFGKLFLFYTVSDSAVRVERLVHSAQDVSQLFR